MYIFPAHLTVIMGLIRQAENLRYFSNTFRYALAEKQPLPRSHILRMLLKFKQHRTSFIRMYTFRRENTNYYSRLPNVANVNGGLKTRVDGGSVEQYRNARLKIQTTSGVCFLAK